MLMMMMTVDDDDNNVHYQTPFGVSPVGFRQKLAINFSLCLVHKKNHLNSYEFRGLRVSGGLTD